MSCYAASGKQKDEIFLLLKVVIKLLKLDLLNVFK